MIGFRERCKRKVDLTVWDFREADIETEWRLWEGVRGRVVQTFYRPAHSDSERLIAPRIET
jgi:hypothetical protein